MSSQGGAPNSWTTVLDAADGNASWAYGLAVDGADNLWVSGMTLNAAGTTPRWTVLKHSVSQTWSDSWTMRQRPLGDTTYSKGRGIVGDAFGNVFSAGELRIGTSGYLGLLRLVPSQPVP